MIRFLRATAIVVVTITLAGHVVADAIEDPACRTCPLNGASAEDLPYELGIAGEGVQNSDRIWLLSSRRLSSNARCINLQDPEFDVYRLDECGRRQLISLNEFEDQLTPARPLVIYVHGNLLDRDEAICRGTAVYRAIRCCRSNGAVDWLIWSWPSSKEGFRWLSDFREKADRTDAQGLYLAWFLRRQVESSLPICLIGYSFGARVVSGSLHALGGGSLGGRSLGGPVVTGAPITAGLVAPAMESTWLCAKGYHGQATKNLQELLILYSRRDAVLKRYWLIDRIRSNVALGYSGPQVFGPRADGSPLPVRSRDCAAAIGKRHKELGYYQERRCNAGAEMARMINARFSTPGI